MGLRMRLHLIWVALTTGSTICEEVKVQTSASASRMTMMRREALTMVIFGSPENPYQSRFEGGPLTRTRKSPSISLMMSVKTSGTW